MMGKLTAAAVAVAGALFAGSVSAATLDFSALTNVSVGPTSTYLGSDGTSVLVSAFNGTTPATVREQLSNPPPTMGFPWEAGLGVISTGGTAPQINPGEVLTFDFSASVEVLVVSLARTGSSLAGPAFNATLDNIFVTGGNLAAGDACTYCSASIPALSSGVSGNLLSITNTGLTDGFYVTGIEYTLSAAPVPLPAGGLLLVGAVAAGAVVTRRRKKAAAA